MSEDSDNNFGLPQPDFQNMCKEHNTKKRMVQCIVLLIGSILFTGLYGWYYEKGWCNLHKVFQRQRDSAESDHVSDKKVEGYAQSSDRVAALRDQADVDEGVNQSASRDAGFESKKRAKKKNNLDSVQKRLEEICKHPKSFVKPGTYRELLAPQGIYHLVVRNYLDKRTAMQMVHQLMQKKLGVYLIIPRKRKGEKYYRVTIGHTRTQHEAIEMLKKFKPIYKEIFILQY